MRVLHVQKVAGIGGSERHLLQLVPALSGKGLTVRMCVLAAGKYVRFLDPLRDSGVDTVVFPSGPDVNPLLPGRLIREIRAFQPDIVHTHLIHADVYGQLATRMAGATGVMSIHGTHGFYRREPYRTAARIAGHLARRVIAISDHVARFVREMRLAPDRAVRVVPYGVDVPTWEVGAEERKAARAELGMLPGDVAVGIASRLIRNKGHGSLIQAMVRVVQEAPQVRLVVAGDGPLRASLEEGARRLLPRGSTSFVGFVGDIHRFMAACDILVFPSLPAFGEGFGLAALEGMATGRPVVATSVDSLVEIVVHGETGFLVRPGNVKELADMLLRLTHDRELRERLGHQARQRAMRTFPLDRMVESTLRVYQEARRSGPSRFGLRDTAGG